MLTYQIIYLLWIKLEADETKTIRNGSSDISADKHAVPRERGS